MTMALSLGFILLFGQGKYRSANPCGQCADFAAADSRDVAPAKPTVPSGLT